LIPQNAMKAMQSNGAERFSGGGAFIFPTGRGGRSRHASSSPRPVSGLAIVKELGSGREAMPLNVIDWHGDIPRPPALFSSAVFLLRRTAAASL
jgi:hypothetical protein